MREGRMRESCSSLTPATDTTMEPNTSPGQQVVMSVEMRKTGVVEIQGMDMTYRNGWQNDTQRVGSHLLLLSKK
jgi:hypothetical protein